VSFTAERQAAAGTPGIAEYRNSRVDSSAAEATGKSWTATPAGTIATEEAPATHTSFIETNFISM
jgi:hypothetical protein